MSEEDVESTLEPTPCAIRVDWYLKKCSEEIRKNHKAGKTKALVEIVSDILPSVIVMILRELHEKGYDVDIKLIPCLNHHEYNAKFYIEIAWGKPDNTTPDDNSLYGTFVEGLKKIIKSPDALLVSFSMILVWVLVVIIVLSGGDK